MNLPSILTQAEPAPQMVYAFIAVALVELVLKGFALWRAARLKQVIWFIAILIFNTAGILPIVYLLVYNKKYKSL